MKKKFYGVFQSINDAKEALGRIKKENLNQVDLTVVYLEPHCSKKGQGDGEVNFEMASEHFLEINRPMISNWPGLHDREIEGYGKVLIGKNNAQIDSQKMEFDKKDFELVEQEIINHKIVAMIEAESDIAGNVRYILESIGADIIEE